MDKYPLDPLLSVRQLREENARHEVVLADQAVRLAMEKIRTAEEEAEQYKVWREEEEDRRFAAIIGTSMNMESIEKFKVQLSDLASGEVERIAAVSMARRQLEERKQEAWKAREAAAQAHKATTKIEFHRDIWREEQRKEENRLEDLEMEEFKSPRIEEPD